MDTIYKLLNANRNTSIALYNKLLDLKGIECTVQKPVKQDSIFGLEDVVQYDELVKEKKKLLVYGIFQESEIGDTEFDTFIDSYVLTLWEDKLPQQTLVIVEFCNRKMSFKVDTHRNISPHNCEQLFIKNMLVPAT